MWGLARVFDGCSTTPLLTERDRIGCCCCSRRWCWRRPVWSSVRRGSVRHKATNDAAPQEVSSEVWTGWDVFWFSVQTSLPIVSITAVEQYRPSHEIIEVGGLPLYFRYDTYAAGCRWRAT
jgi:hypothetical protein